MRYMARVTRCFGGCALEGSAVVAVRINPDGWALILGLFVCFPAGQHVSTHGYNKKTHGLVLMCISDRKISTWYFYLYFCSLNILQVRPKIPPQHKLTSVRVPSLVACGPCWGAGALTKQSLAPTAFPFTTCYHRGTDRGCENASAWSNLFLEEEPEMYDSNTILLKKRKRKETELPRFHFLSDTCHIYSVFSRLVTKS